MTQKSAFCPRPGTTSGGWSRTPFVLIGAMVLGFGLGCMVVPSLPPASPSLYTEALPSTRPATRVPATLGPGEEAEDLDEAAVVGGDWPSHVPPPHTLAHRKPPEITPSDVDPSEVFSSDWPAHFPEPHRLAHPRPPEVGDVEPVGTSEVYSSEWPAHFPPPRKLAHPAPTPKEQPSDMDASELLSAHFPEPHDTPHTHPLEDDGEVPSSDQPIDEIDEDKAPEEEIRPPTEEGSGTTFSAASILGLLPLSAVAMAVVAGRRARTEDEDYILMADHYSCALHRRSHDVEAEVHGKAGAEA